MKGIVSTGGGEQGVIHTDDLVLSGQLGPREVRVRIEAAGVCGSDLSVATGKIGWLTPSVMGHEGAGVVVEVGASVTACAVGDHVVLSTLANCGHCGVCETGNPTECGSPHAEPRTPFTLDGQPVYQFAQTSCFTEETIVSENQAVPISKDVPFAAAALIGCGVITGVGAVFNRAHVALGDTVGVIGVGGVGLNVIQGAALSGARQIIAIDTVASKETLARQFGATDFIHVSAPDFDTVAAVHSLAPSGVDHAFEVVGVPALIQTCIDMTASGGNIVQVGVAGMEASVIYTMHGLYQNKNILGCRYGGARPRADFPMLAGLYLAGKLKLDELITNTASFDGLEQAFADIRSGAVARTVMIPG